MLSTKPQHDNSFMIISLALTCIRGIQFRGPHCEKYAAHIQGVLNGMLTYINLFLLHTVKAVLGLLCTY